MRRTRHNQKGTVVLVALCFVAVMGIAITTYLTLSSRAMNLSARSFHAGLSEQLAEAGIERALSSLNNSSWTGWTTSGTSATRNLSSSEVADYGLGITPSVKLLVLNKDATSWSAATSYTVGQAAWQDGKWYQCVRAHSNQAPPNKTYWICAPTTWSPTVTYYNDASNKGDDMVVYEGVAYRCTAANTNQAPPNSSYWTVATSGTWNASTNYSANRIVFSGGGAYRCISSNSGQKPPNTTYWAGAPAIYAEGVVNLPDGSPAIRTQVRAEFVPAPLFVNAIGATNTASTSVSFASATGTVDSYNSDINPGATSYTSPTQVGTLSNYSAVVAGPSVTASGATTISGYVAVNGTAFSSASSTIVKGSSATPTPKVTSSRVVSNPYVPTFDVRSISGGSLINGTGYLADVATSLGTPGAATPTIYNITATYDGGYLYSGLYLSDSSDVLTINGPVVLNVTGTLYLNNGRIVVSPTGSLEVRFTGQLFLGYPGSGGIENQTYDPKKLLIVGTNSTTSSGYNYFRQRGDFYGRLYMPNAHIHFWNYSYRRQFYGAILGRIVRFEHSVDVHYDLSLRNVSGTGTFIDSPMEITSWRELTDPAEQISL